MSEPNADLHSTIEQCIRSLLDRLTPRPDVVSIYVSEGPNEPVILAANVGLLLGGRTISMRRGEGLTGSLIKSPHLPLMTDLSSFANKSIDDIGEQRFPAFLGVALPPDENARGALVLQRVVPFQPSEGFMVSGEILVPLYDKFLAAPRLLDEVRAFQPRLTVICQ